MVGEEVGSRGYGRAIRAYNHEHSHDSKPWLDNIGTCVMCGATERMSNHHLIPQSVWLSKTKMKYVFGDDPPSDGERTVKLCWNCHNFLHGLVSNEALARFINTPEKLAEWYKDRWSFPSTLRREPTRAFVVNTKDRHYSLMY